jgi:hypothetical protein
LGDVVVVEFVVAEGDVYVQSQVDAVLEEQALVDVDGFLVVGPQVVDRCQAQLVLEHVLQLFVVLHQSGFVSQFVRQVEVESGF